MTSPGSEADLLEAEALLDPILDEKKGWSYRLNERIDSYEAVIENREGEESMARGESYLEAAERALESWQKWEAVFSESLRDA